MPKKLPRDTCPLCGQEYIAGRDELHRASATCISYVNLQTAVSSGYIIAYHHYYAGNVSRKEWAQPFLREFYTAVSMDRLSSRWWAMSWWLRAAARSVGKPDRDDTMNQIRKLYEEGKQDELDTLLGMLEFAAEQP